MHDIYFGVSCFWISYEWKNIEPFCRKEVLQLKHIISWGQLPLEMIYLNELFINSTKIFFMLMLMRSKICRREGLSSVLLSHQIETLKGNARSVFLLLKKTNRVKAGKCANFNRRNIVIIRRYHILDMFMSCKQWNLFNIQNIAF